MFSFRILSFAMFVFLLSTPRISAGEGRGIQHDPMEVHPEIPLRVQTFARRQVVVSNPIRWSQFVYLVPEGSVVREGDLMFEFDLAAPEHRETSLENRMEDQQNQVRVRLGNVEERIVSLRDELARLEDQREVQRARLEYLRSLPRSEDVAIARGRLEVAERNLEAARVERDTAKSRLERGLVAPAILERAESALRIQAARAEHARNRLRTTSQPTHPHDLRVVELRIENLRLEAEKLEGEITSQEEILRIETRSAERQIQEIERELEEVREELRQGRVYAPRDGVVIYTSRLKRELTSGGKPAKGMALAEIPEPDSIALRGRIPEDARALFRAGDHVDITLNPLPDAQFSGRLHSISSLPRDIAEGDRGTGDDTETGVKVYDVVITFDTLPPNLPIGVYGTARLRTADPVRGPAVPLSWVRVRDGRPHLSVNGVFVPVDGVSSGAWFVVPGEEVDLNRVSPDGEWPTRQTEEDLLSTDRVTATGQLEPLESVEVTAPAVRAWDLRVESLVPEDTRVEKGDQLAVLDSERLSNQLNNVESDVTRRTSQREAAEEELTSRRREARFQLTRAENLLEIRKLEAELVETSVSASQLHQAMLDKEVARENLASSRRELARLERTPDLSSPVERKAREREVRRRELQLEQAEIELEKAKAGAGPVQRSQARLEHLRQKANLAQLQSSSTRRVRQAENRVRWRTRRERSRREQLEQARENIEALTVRAPADGIVKYENLWDGIGVSKLRVGLGMAGRTPMMRLSDSARMVIRVSVSERYVRHLAIGQNVQVRIPSEGSRIWEGEVVAIREFLEPTETGSLRAGVYANHEPPLEHAVGVEVLLRDSEEWDLTPGAVSHVIFPFAR